MTSQKYFANFVLLYTEDMFEQSAKNKSYTLTLFVIIKNKSRALEMLQ